MKCILNFPKDEFYTLSKLTAPRNGSGYASYENYRHKTQVRRAHTGGLAFPAQSQSTFRVLNLKCTWR